MPEPRKVGPLIVPGEGTTDIVMKEELIQVRISPDQATIRVTFVMFNSTHHDTSIEVGFLGREKDELGNFKASVDRRPVAVREETPSVEAERVGTMFGALTDKWKMWDMEFAGGQTRTIEVSYVTPVRTQREELKVNPETSPWYAGQYRAGIGRALEVREVSYILWTGSYWKDPIGRCRIEVLFDGIDPRQVMVQEPEGGSVRDGKIVWDLRDYEPQGYLRVKWSPHRTAGTIHTVLENILTHDPGNMNLELQLGAMLAARGANRRQLAIYQAALDRWDGRLPVKVSEDVLWTMARVLMGGYHALGMTAQARAVAPKIERLAAEKLRRAGPRMPMGKFGDWDFDEAKAMLDLCRNYMPG